MSTTSASRHLPAPPGSPARQLDFFRRKDAASGAPSHEVTYFLMGADRWDSAPGWPPPDTSAYVLHLHPGARAGGGSGLLGEAASGNAAVDSYRYDPLVPIPARGGRVIHLGRSTPGPIDLSWQLDRSDVLSYQTPPLSTAVDVVGRVRADLRVEIDQPDTDVVVRLVDCWPDGRIYPVAEGIVRLRDRTDAVEQHDRSGQVLDVRIGLGYTAQRFKAGHRMGLLITSSAFPHADRNLNSLEPSVTSGEARTVTVNLHPAGSTLTVDAIDNQKDI
ncbi:CocE/NonD family hydrolase [Nocardioides sp. TF02-7]|uniref:CocE/NonD family hydrolase n=1 Tax=Nocardioides sp. TF02-7 TaxID=2917724 RepID=UPI0023DC3081|nr:CocE/NonD family hydrolase [Nocardioides sp. TF02-7]